MKVALYSRVSTKEQDNQIQLSQLREYSENQGWTVYGEYSDVISGTKQRRPELDRLFQDIIKYDGVICLRIDRFGRSLKHFLSNVERLTDTGKFFVATTQGIIITPNHTDPSNNFLMNVLGAAAEFEHDLISIRVSDSIKHRQMKGIPLGRKNVIELKGIPYEKVIELHNNGRSIRQIAMGLGLKRSTVYRYLKGVPKRLSVSGTQTVNEIS